MATIPFSIVRYFQSRVTALTGVELDLLKSPKRDVELGKAKLLHEYCQGDLNVVMAVIDAALEDAYILGHPSLALVHRNVEELLFTVNRRKARQIGDYLNRVPVEDRPKGGYLNRDYQTITKRRIVL